MQGWMDGATLARTLNLQGRFLAYPAENLPFLLREGMECALVPPATDAPRNVTVRSVEAAQGKHEGGFFVTFDEVDSIETAELLIGCHCLVRESDVQQGFRRVSDESEEEPVEPVDPMKLMRFFADSSRSSDGLSVLDEAAWKVVDEEAGLIGTLSEIEENPGQSLLVVKREASNSGDASTEVLIPFVDEFVVAVDDEERIFHVHVPSGLLEL